MGTSIDKVQDEKQAQPSSSSSPQNEIQPLSNTLKYLTAAAIFYSNGAFGCAYNTYGPVITTMQHKYDTDDSTISKVFTILTGCYMIGALCAGFIYNYVNRQLAVIVILSIMTAIMFLTPHCPSMALFFVSAAIMGLTCGSYDTAQFVWMMEMLQKDCPPYVQSQHFFYAVGTTVAGWIMAPFLDKDEDEEEKSSYLITGETDFRLTNDSTLLGIIPRKTENEDGSKLAIPYSIVGGLLVLSVVFHLLLFIFLRYRPPPPEIDVPEADENGNEEKQMTREEVSETIIFGKKMWSMPKLRMVLLCASFYAAYQGMEMCTFQFFSKFAQNSEVHLSESKAAYVLTGMTAAFAVGRGVSIVAVFKIPLLLILCVNIVLTLVANILLVGWASSSLSVLWTSSIIFGLGFSSVYASFSAFAERYLNFTNFIGSLMLVFGSGVAAIYPLIVGSFIEDNPIVLSYVSFFSIVLLILSLGTLGYLTHKNKTRY